MFSVKKMMAASATVLAVSAGTAALSAGPAQAAPCGFYHNDTSSYYNHCGSANVVVDVKYYDYFVPQTRHDCLEPGITYLGNYDYSTASGVYYATSAGDPC